MRRAAIAVLLVGLTSGLGASDLLRQSPGRAVLLHADLGPNPGKMAGWSS